MVAIVALVATCMRYVFACVLSCIVEGIANFNYVALRCVALHTLRYMRTVAYVGPWAGNGGRGGRMHRLQACLVDRSCAGRLVCRAVHYYNSALHGAPDKATCTAAIYQTGLEWVKRPG